MYVLLNKLIAAMSPAGIEPTFKGCCTLSALRKRSGGPNGKTITRVQILGFVCVLCVPFSDGFCRFLRYSEGC
jgi:hypothetical protein